MQMEHPLPITMNSDYGRELQDEARAEQIQSDARIIVALQDALTDNRWPILDRAQCERLLSVMTEAAL